LALNDDFHNAGFLIRIEAKTLTASRARVVARILDLLIAVRAVIDDSVPTLRTKRWQLLAFKRDVHRALSVRTTAADGRQVAELLKPGSCWSAIFKRTGLSPKGTSQRAECAQKGYVGLPKNGCGPISSSLESSNRLRSLSLLEGGRNGCPKTYDLGLPTILVRITSFHDGYSMIGRFVGSNVSMPSGSACCIQFAVFPSFGPGFDSHRPLHKSR
jgi:hypothetical protein